ncbi:plectin isoform X1 [Manduca sexta]|uniref:plectin isoform X1 n=1 Tax=Manduca sexta TaxID=7130 RepID=UPI00188EB1D0|nr:plectin isoform X1 [Manduca sexta]XP_037292867.1 plectin isoform X1 [Manduca sexta]XP_037292868.1 plectin isoform X1 [Manduca sexta]XP_037292869.1 plectin isoform X1 [Manduca sexta]
MMKFKSLFRRGPSQGKQEATLKGAPSVSSLDSKHHKVAPAREKTLKIFGSKEKLHKAHKKKDLGNNNAVLEDPELPDVLEYEDGRVRHDYGSAEELGVSVDERGSQECVSLPVTLNADHMPGFQEVELRPRVPSEASLASEAREIESLRRELEATAMERAQLQARVDELMEKATEADKLRTELERLKNQEVEREAALERLADENGALRARLRGVAHSPLSDSEKRQLLLAPAPRRMHSSAPASIALAHNGEGDSGEATTPEWDKHSSSSLSEVSVACLQDRILQMEEHHYSTSEELQATLAELADLQTQLADAHADNERLADEKQVLLESLCRQTEKLEDSRTKVDTLQELLLREGIEPETLAPGDTDQQLLAVLKLSQEEKRHLLAKQEQLETELTETKTALEEKTKENEALTERIRSLESAAEQAEAERGAAERDAAARQHQLATLSDLLDAARAKLSERAGAAEGAAEAEAAAAAARREADAASARAAALQDCLAHAQRQLDRAHHDARKLHDDALVSRNNAKSTISELEFQLEQLRQEKTAMQGEIKTLQDNVGELQVQVQVASDEKLSLMTRAGEAIARAADFERQLTDARQRLAQLTRDRERDETEWKQFQSDLLMTVRVANDFKTEAQRELERLVSENKIARDRIRLLEDQIHSMKGVERSESMDSVLNDSEEDRELSKDSDFLDSQSDSERPSKEIFKDIRTRYLSRVHSVTDPPTREKSLVDQAFFRSNSVPEPVLNREDLGEQFKIDIKNVTTDETNDDIQKQSSTSSEEDANKVLAEDVLPSFDGKELKRQDAIDLFNEKVIRQDAVDKGDETNSDDNIDLSNVKIVSKSESNKTFETKDVGLVFKKSLTGVFNGKPKALSMDNLNSNQKYKDALQEATSIEFLNGAKADSQLSVYTEGSDDVFVFSLEKNNNVVSKVTDNESELNTAKDIPVVKAESILPFPYPDDIKTPPKDLLEPLEIPPREVVHETTNDKVEKDLKRVNEELKLTFKAAIERIIGENRMKRSDSSRSSSDSSVSSKSNSIVDFSKYDAIVEDKIAKEVLSGLHLKTFRAESIEEPTKQVAETDNQLEKDKVGKNVIAKSKSVGDIPVIPINNPFLKPIKKPKPIETPKLNDNKIDHNVTYHLKINTNDPCRDENLPKVVAVQSHTNAPAMTPRRKLKTFVTPLNFVNGQIDNTKPIIISPILIQPVLLKSSTVEPETPHDKKTVYYDDTDQSFN